MGAHQEGRNEPEASSQGDRGDTRAVVHGATREICDRCNAINRVAFSVPSLTWQKVSMGRWDILCLGCFTELADEMFIPWDAKIAFWPVSLRTHLGLGKDEQKKERPLTVTQRARMGDKE